MTKVVTATSIEKFRYFNMVDQVTCISAHKCTTLREQRHPDGVVFQQKGKWMQFIPMHRIGEIYYRYHYNDGTMGRDKV